MMRRRVLGTVLVGLGCLVSACTTQVMGSASPQPSNGSTTQFGGQLPGGAEPSCLVSCEDDGSAAPGYTGGRPAGSLAMLPPGLLCRDLAAMGYGPQDAVDYWFAWAEPDQMDADLNGIPCETVWPGMQYYMPG